MSDDLDYEAGDINTIDGPVADINEDTDYVEGDVNSTANDAPISKQTVEYLLDAVVDDKEAVFVDSSKDRDGRVRFDVHVSPDDTGKIIGRKGRVIQAIRQVVRAAGGRDGVSTTVEVDDGH